MNSNTLPESVELPAPTAWPIVLAFGITLLFAGLLTTASISILGALLSVAGIVGWFRDVLPREQHEIVPVADRAVVIATARPQVQRVRWVTEELSRARLPLEIYPISAGIKGGLAGSVVMAIIAMLYGIFSGHGIWYPINLLSLGFFPEITSLENISAFHLGTLIISSALHLFCSLLVGLLYGAMLPMFPRRPILLGGIIGPVLWTGVIHSVLDVVNPAMNRRIDWWWFVISQIGFGLVAGFVVSRQQRIRTWQYLPFPVRAGIETPGAVERDEENIK